MELEGFSNSVLEFSEYLGSVKSIDDAWDAYLHKLEEFGVSSAIYGFFTHPQTRKLSQEITILSSHPDDWNDRYIEGGYIDHDVLAKYCMVEANQSLVWGDPRANHLKTDFSETVASEATEFGLSQGLTIPFRDASGFRLGGTGISVDNMNEREFQVMLRTHRDDLEQIALLFHSKAQTRDAMTQFFPLTHREKECLVWASVGLYNKEIAHRLSISERTVEHHIKRAANRLNARNRTHAVARALVFRLIQP